MARVVLVQYWIVDHLGLMSLSSILRTHGHESTILVRYEEKDLVKKIQHLKADIVGFSCTTGGHLHALRDARIIKKSIPEVITIMGGPHATFSPEVICNDGLDVVCRGEGENSLVALADHVRNKTDYSAVANLWVKKGKQILKNAVAPLIENLDNLPFADRSHYNRYPILRTKRERAVMFGRGCPYDCSFCFNSSLKDMYNGKGRYVRRRTIDSVIRELEELKNRYFVKQIAFEDDTFLEDKNWILQFLREYKKHIDIPYICNTRFDTLTDDVVKMLKSTGCFLVALGIESGCEKRREQIFKKGLKTQDILLGAEILHKNGLEFRAYNIIGSPNESVDEAIDTIMLNRKVKPDVPFVSLFQPYPATEIVKEYNIDCKCDQMPSSFWSASVIKQGNIRELGNLCKLFYLLLHVPLSRKAMKLLAKIHIFEPLYEFLFKLYFFYYSAKSSRISFLKVIDYAWRQRKMY